MPNPFAFDVSFIITVFNKAPYLGPMLRSLERQTGDFSREFIFVDDGSTDNSVELIKNATSTWNNVRIIRQENAGPAIATNTGGFAAKGEFIKIVDADDVMTPFATKHLLATIKKTGVDYLYGKWRYANAPEEESLQEVDFVGDFREYPDPLTHFVKYGMAGSTNVLCRTSVFREVGGADPELFVQDMSMPLRFAKNHRIGTVDVMAVMGPKDVEGRIMGKTLKLCIRCQQQCITSCVTTRMLPRIYNVLHLNVVQGEPGNGPSAITARRSSLVSLGCICFPACRSGGKPLQ